MKLASTLLSLACGVVLSTVSLPGQASLTDSQEAGVRTMVPLDGYRAWMEAARGQSGEVRIRLYREKIVAGHPEIYRLLAALMHLPEESLVARILPDAVRSDEEHAQVLSTMEEFPGAVQVVSERFFQAFPGARQAMTVLMPAGYDAFREFTAARTIAVGTAFVPSSDIKSLQVGLVHESFHMRHTELSSISVSAPHLGQRLWAEGMATFAERVVYPGLTLAEILGRADIASICYGHRAEWADLALPLFESSRPQDLNEWFHPDGASGRSGVPARAGQCLGYLAVERMIQRYSFDELSSWTWAEAGPRLQMTVAAIANERVVSSPAFWEMPTP